MGPDSSSKLAFLWGDPRLSWGLPKGMLLEGLDDPQNSTVAERIALMEACLVLATLGEPGMLTQNLQHTIIQEFCCMAELNKPNRILVRFGGSLLGELQANIASIHLSETGALATIRLVPDAIDPADHLISYIRRRLGVLMDPRIQGGKIYRTSLLYRTLQRHSEQNE